MKKSILILAATAIVAASCTKEKFASPSLKTDDSVVAMLLAEDAGTKVHLNGTTVYWTAEDKISIFSDASVDYTNNLYTLTDGANTADATFNGSFEGEAKMAAVYPYDAANSFNGTAITVNMPSSYVYVEGEINKAPMASLITAQTEPIAFKNAAALLAVTVNNIPAGYNKAVLTSSTENITGQSTITFGEGVPTLAGADGAKTIEITFPAAGTPTNKTFYFPLPVANYTSLEVSITDGIETKVLKTKALNAQRSVRYRTTVTLDSVSGTLPTTANDVAAANTAFASGTTTNVEIETITAPAQVILPDTDKSVSVTLPETTQPIEITVPASPTDEPAVLNLYIPEGDISNITFNVPNTTVYVNGVLTDVSAYTALHTLYVNTGSRITGTLYVGKGNVRIQNGASVAKVDRTHDNTDPATYIYIEDGVVSPQIIGENIVVMPVQAVVTTEAALREALTAGGEITLGADITATSAFVVGGNTVLDGNGHTITSTAGRAINVSGAENATIKNLTIEASGERAINIIQNSKNVTIDNVTATAANYTVNVAASAPNAVVAISNSTLNGLCTVNVAAQAANVSVDNSTVNCNDNNTTAGESYAALSLNKEAINGSIVATNSTINVTAESDSYKGRNGAEDGTVTINGSEEDVLVIVAVITYDASPYYHGFSTLAEAVEFAKAGDEITLIRGIELEETIEVNKDITINLAGKSLAVNVAGGRAFDIVDNDVDFTLDAEGSAVSFGNGTYGIIQFKGEASNNKVTVNGGTFTGTTDAGAFVRYRTGTNNALTLNNVNYTDNCSIQGAGKSNPYVISTAGAPSTGNSITVNGGSYTAGGFVATHVESTLFDGVTVNATGLAFELKNGVVNNCKITLNPGQYVYSIDGAGVIASDNGEVTVNNTTITVSGENYGVVVAPTGGVVNVNNCTINAANKYFVHDQYAGKTGTIKENGTVVNTKTTN